MKIYLTALLSLVLLSPNTPKPAASCKCGPTLYIAAGNDPTLMKIIVLNTSTGLQTIYPQPTGLISYPQDGGFTYTITFVWDTPKSGWNAYYANFSNTECGNSPINGTHGVISFNTLCENYEVGYTTGAVEVCNN